ncbi:MAG: radical SAM protein [Prevotella sp.]|nr:radical SAM protein [Prevotella sp.]
MARNGNNPIYIPQGRAFEYARYACNFYVGCSNDCDYCYCKRGVLAKAMGKPYPTLKKCFVDEQDAFNRFKENVKRFLPELRANGLFFTFTSDPMLVETRDLHWKAALHAVEQGINVKILTKRADFIEHLELERLSDDVRKRIAWGFTLTGFDNREPHASTNAERIAAMKRLHDMGFKTFASIEPVIIPLRSLNCIMQTRDFCDLYKIGLMSGHKDYTRTEVEAFIKQANDVIDMAGGRVYWKESVSEFVGYPIECSCGVSADYDMFAEEE